MTLIERVKIKKEGSLAIPRTVKELLNLKLNTLVSFLKLDEGVILITEDTEIREKVEANSQLLKEGGLTVSALLKELKKQRKEQYGAKSA